MVKNLTTTTILGSKFYVFWVHSGGADAKTGDVSHASMARLAFLAALMKRHVADGVPVMVVFSGDSTRKSGGWDQAQVMATEFSNHHQGDFHIKVLPMGVEDAYRYIVEHMGKAEWVKFICEDAHIGHFLARMVIIDPKYAERVEGHDFDALTRANYTKAYPLNDIVVRNAVTWFRLAVKQVGVIQIGLKVLDMMFNKPTKNPVTLWITRHVTKRLREDLRG